ncbi:unnamed protein product [Lampetra planeri]
MLFSGSQGPLRRALQATQAVAGVVGSLCALVAAASSRWDAQGGLWDDPQPRLARAGFRDDTAVQAERVYAGTACVLACAGASVCLHMLLFWDQRRHGTPALHRERTLVPSSLLLAVLMPTGVLTLIPWASFTVRSGYEGGPGLLRFGYSYGLALIGWLLLLVVVPVLAALENCLEVGGVTGGGVTGAGVATQATVEAAAAAVAADVGPLGVGQAEREPEPERERLLRKRPRDEEGVAVEMSERTRPASAPVRSDAKRGGAGGEEGGGGGGGGGGGRRGGGRGRRRKDARQTRAY